MLPQLPEHDSERHNKLAEFCQQNEQQHIMTGSRGMRLHYCFYPQANKPLIVIAPGRAEAAFKYRELAMDCFSQGYQVAVMDHRGQGLSQRFFPQRQLGHMDDFDFAAKDLLQVAKRCHFDKQQPCYLIAHSMGATIGLRAMQIKPEQFDRAVLSAPMLGLSLPAPRCLLQTHLALSSYQQKRRWRKQKVCPNYVSSSRQDYCDKGFAGNDLTGSEIRYKAFRQMYEAQPELKLGGPTSNWLYQALLAMSKVHKQAAELKSPMLFALAEDEQVVDPKGQRKLRRKLRSQPVENHWLAINESRHEPLFEVDSIRTPLLKQIFDFLK